MGLVDYGSSDEDSQEESDNSNESKDLKTNKSNGKQMESSSVNTPEESTSNLFSKLPAPKTVSNQTNPNSSLNDIVVDKSSSGPIKILVPSLKTYIEDNSDEEEEKKPKRFKGSTTGTGLSSILPKPKNSAKTTVSSFIPQSLVRPKASLKRPLNSSKSKPEVQTNEQNINFFFSEDGSAADPVTVPKDIHLSDVEFGPKPVPTSETISMNSSANPSLDDVSYKKLIASKFGEEAPEDINIVDIDVSKHLSESKDWLKTISEEKEEEYSGVQPSSTARRKHQITYLALQAKQREVELKNEWARSRTTKTMSRAKYGF